MKRINHNITPYIKVIIFFLIVLLIASLISCNPTKQIAKAEHKVLGNPEAIKRVREKTDHLFPIIGEIVFSDTGSIKTIIKDTTITKTVTIPVKVWKNISFDTLINGLSFYIDSNGITVTGKYECQNTTKYIPTYYHDPRILKQKDSTINNLKIELAGKNGEQLTLQNQSREKDKTIRNKNILIYMLSGFIAIILFLWLRTKIKLPNISKFFKK